MIKQLICIGSSCLFSCLALAQDATAVLRKAAEKMGSDQLNTLRISGSGSGASFGQAYRPGVPWPKLAISSYSREIDFGAPATSETIMRARAEPQGGGAVPIKGEGRQQQFIHGRLGWDTAGPLVRPRQAIWGAQAHDLWTSPHGVVKAASRGKARLEFVSRGGRELAAVSYGEPGVYSATAFFNDEFILERVESRYSDNVLGDVPVVTTYSEHRLFGPIVHPTRIQQSVAGHPTLDLTIKEVQPNAKVEIAVPDIVAKAAGAGENVTMEKAAEGVWFVAGGSHNSAAIEMKDHVILVESPLNDARALAVINAVRKTIPGKPVRTVVNSHSHFDHSGGLRAAVGEGLAVITHANNKAYFEKAFATPARVNPDHLAKSGKKAKVVGVKGPMVLGDGTRKVEVRAYSTDHVDGFLMVYLPQEKLLIQADGFTPGPPNSPPPSPPNNYGQAKLVEAIESQKLQVERHLPLHGRIVPNAELYRAAGKPL
jgi:glyoxylase-like metal-dependent hydrolase (beta-lactamase superfamily II)